MTILYRNFVLKEVSLTGLSLIQIKVLYKTAFWLVKLHLPLLEDWICWFDALQQKNLCSLVSKFIAVHLLFLLILPELVKGVDKLKDDIVAL